MSKIKNILATLAVAATATLSLTLVASAATNENPPSGSEISWTLGGTGYWVAKGNADLSIYTNSFSGSGNISKLTVDKGRGSLTGLNGHTLNYKSISVTLTNKNGESKTTFDFGSKETVSTRPSVSGKLDQAKFFASMLDGDGDGASLLNGYSLTLNNNSQ